MDIPLFAKRGLRVALVHDYLTQYGGAERVLEELALLFPDAPIFTLLYDEEATGRAFAGRTIHTSFLQRLPFASSWYRLLPIVMPLAIERFDLSAYDVVISSSSSFAKGVITREDAIHICYCHTPTRFAWLDYKKIAGVSLYPKWLAPFVPLVLPYIRLWDRLASRRVDVYVCNSRYIRDKIYKYYRVGARLVYPPVHTKRFTIGQAGERFLLVGRMLPYKRFDIVIEAFNKTGLPLTVVGSGPEYERLHRMAKGDIRFLGNVSDERLAAFYASSRALLFPQEEDFGISALESMAAGVPLIAYQAGGALEYVREGENGVFFSEQTSASLNEAIERFERMSFNPEAVRASVLRFDRTCFAKQMMELVEQSIRERVRIRAAADATAEGGRA